MVNNLSQGLTPEKKWSILCYIPVFNVIFCVLTSIKMVNSRFCLFHARQGLLLFLFWIIILLIAFISKTISLMLWGVVLFLHGLGFFAAYTGKNGGIPIVSLFVEKIPPYYLYRKLTGKEPEIPEDDDLSPESNNIQK